MVVGSAPGGGNDRVSRLVASLLHDETPGTPTFVVQNQAGASGLVAANFVLNKSPGSSVSIVGVNEMLVLQQALGNPKIQFDLRKVHWLGSVSSFPTICIARADSSIQSIDDVLTSQMLVAGSSAGTLLNVFPVALNASIGTKFKLVSGYAGSAEALLAVERGEVDGICAGMLPKILDWLKSGKARALLVIGKIPENQPAWGTALQGVPNVESYLQKSSKRSYLDAVLMPLQMVYAFALGQEIPPADATVLERAFQRAVNNPALEEELAREGEIFAPQSSEQIATIVDKVLAISPDVLADLKRLITD